MVQRKRIQFVETNIFSSLFFSADRSTPVEQRPSSPVKGSVHWTTLQNAIHCHLQGGLPPACLQSLSLKFMLPVSPS